MDPVPDLMDADHLIVDNGAAPIELVMREHRAMVLPAETVPGYAGTYVWSYLKPKQTTRASYVGPMIAVTRGIPTEVKFVNNLGSAATTNVLAYKYSTDQTLAWADPLGARANRLPGVPKPGSAGARNYAGPIPACVHLHGGEVPSLLDGNPNAWFTSDGAYKGKRFYTKGNAAATNYCVYSYPNSQESALLWFHDHTLGVARLNLYAGLAGAYLIQDPLYDPAGLPPLVPLVIQDRMFDDAGQLFFPAASAGGVPWAANPEHPYWVPEFYGDVNVVNGKSWPFMDVEQKRYTFLFINGSNARTYELSLTDPASGNPGPPMWVIGTDGGYLDVPVRINPAGVANRVLPIDARREVLGHRGFCRLRGGRVRHQRPRLHRQLGAQERRQDPLPGRPGAEEQPGEPRHAVQGGCRAPCRTRATTRRWESRCARRSSAWRMSSRKRRAA